MLNYSNVEEGDIIVSDGYYRKVVQEHRGYVVVSEGVSMGELDANLKGHYLHIVTWDYLNNYGYKILEKIKVEEVKEYSMDEIAEALEIEVGDLKIKKD